MNNTSASSPAAASAAKTFRKEILVRFSDCDPVGIVFYPKYLEMFNALIEDWCRDELKFSFNEIVGRRGWGLPTVHLEVDFIATSSYGDKINASLNLLTMGKSSITVGIALSGPDGAGRVKGKATLVLIDRAQTRAMTFPEDFRQRLVDFGVTT